MFVQENLYILSFLSTRLKFLLSTHHVHQRYPRDFYQQRIIFQDSLQSTLTREGREENIELQLEAKNSSKTCDFV